MNLTKKQTEFVLSKFLVKPTELSDLLEMVLNWMTTSYS